MQFPGSIETLRDMILHGEYDQVLSRPDLVDEARAYLSNTNIPHLMRLQLSTLLAELYDQTSHYDIAATLIAFDSDGRQALEDLREKSKEAYDAHEKWRKAKSNPKLRDKVEPLPTIPRADTHYYRSIARFGLAHAISLHRKTGDKGVSLDRATELGGSIHDQLRVMELANFHFEGTQSFVAYWLGRFHMLRNDLDSAERSFNKAIHYQHLNLSRHFEEHDGGILRHHVGNRRTCPKCQRKIALSSYHLASIMAFGLGIIKLRGGKISESLTQFRSARVLLEGCSSDRYREGYAQLLAGTAHRILIGPHADKLKVALDQLLESRLLFGQSNENGATHRYYAARATFQLSTTHLYASKDRSLDLGSRFQALKLASVEFCNLSASVAHTANVDVYADLDLRARAQILRSRIVTQMLRTLSIAQLQKSDSDLAISFLSQLGAISNIERLSTALVKKEHTLMSVSLFHRLAQTSREQLRAASETDKALRGDDSHRPSLVIAESALSFALSSYTKIAEAVTTDSAEWVLIEQLRLISSKLALRAKEQLESLLQSALADNSKVQAAAHIGLARLAIARDDVSAVRKQIKLANLALSHGVESELLRDEVIELEQMIPDPPDEIVVSVRIGGRDLSIGEVEADFRARLAKWAYDNRMNQQEAADHFGVNPKTIGAWGKPLKIRWPGRRSAE